MPVMLLISLKTVPKTVSLTSAIDPRALRHANITLNVDWSGQMTLSGFFRVRSLSLDKSMKTCSPLASILTLTVHLRPQAA